LNSPWVNHIQYWISLLNSAARQHKQSGPRNQAATSALSCVAKRALAETP
jgi:hypothetical protein